MYKRRKRKYVTLDDINIDDETLRKIRMKIAGVDDESKLKVYENKKVKHATACSADGIDFKSKLEMYCYLWFKSEGIMLNYESTAEQVEQDFSVPDNVNIYVGRKKRNSNERYMGRSYKFQDMCYTPDFSLIVDNNLIYIETKGNSNDTYPMYKKLFIRNLCRDSAANKNVIYYFFEPHTHTEVQQTCEIIKNIINGRKETDK